MVLQNILSQEIVQKLGWTLLHFVWQAAAVALLLGILLAILRKSSAGVRYIIACVAMGLIVLLPIITIQMIHVSTPRLPIEMEPAPKPVITAVQPTTEEIPPAIVVQHEEPAQLENTVEAPSIPWKQRVIERLDPALPYLVAGWLLGVFGLSLWHLGGWAQLQRLRKKLVKQVDTSINEKLLWLSEQLRVKQTVQLLESALVQVPTVVGWLRPVILLPASALTGLTAEQLEALLAHELAHIRRYDYLVNMLQTVIETLGFYHPAVWWISHRIRVERENCCDDLAVSISGDRVRYARALTSMEEIRTGRGELAVAATGGNLFTRIRRIVGKDSNDSSRASWIPSAITILLIAIISVPTTIALTTKSKSREPEQKTEQITDKQNEFDGRTIPTEQESTNQKTITGIVRDEKGRPLEGVKLNLMTGLQQDFISDDDGKFEVSWDSQQWRPLGFPLYIQARHEQLNLATIVEINEDVETLDIKLKPGVVLFGKAVDSEGKGIAGARTMPVLIYSMGGIELGRPQTRSDSDGNFEINAIPAGHEYWVLARADGYRIECSLPIQTDDTAADRRFDAGIITLPVGIFYVTGIVVDTNDEPVADAIVSIDGEDQLYQQKRTDANGEFAFEKLCAGRVQICAIAAGTTPLKGSIDTYAGADDIKIVVTKKGTNGFIPKQPHSLVGSKLPELQELQIAVRPDDLKDRKILLCFWDMGRSSQNSISKLAKREKELTEKNVIVLLVHASGVESSKVKEWLAERKIPFICGSIKDNVVEVLSRWGALREPWLILTDKNGTVRAEGFDIKQLDEKLQETSSEVLIESLEKSKVGAVPRASALVENSKAPAEGKTSIYLDCVILEVNPPLKMGKEISNMPGNAPMLDSPLYMSSADLLLGEAAGDKQTSQDRINILIKKLASRGRAKMLKHPTLQLDEVQTHKFETGDSFLQVMPNAINKDGSIYMSLKAAFHSKLIQEHRKQNPIITRREFADLICTRPGDILIIGSPIRIEEGPEDNNNAMNSKEKTTDLVFILTPTLVDATGKPQNGIDEPSEILKEQNLRENLQEGMGIATDVENKTHQKQLNEILAKFSDGTTEDKSDSNSKIIRETVESYIAAALAGEDKKAAEYVYPGSSVTAQTSYIYQALQGQNIRIVGMCIDKWNSWAISSVIKTDQGTIGYIVFELNKVILAKKVLWLIDEIDLNAIDTIGEQIHYFFKVYPDAKMIIINQDTSANKQSDASVESESSDKSRQEQTPTPNVPKPAKSPAPSAEDKSIVRIDLAWIEMLAGSQVDKETTVKIRNLLGGKITIPDSPAAADLLRKAAGATAPVKDESTGDKRVTQKEFNTLFDLLVSKGYAKIIMRPTLEVVDGETANIRSKQKIPNEQTPREDLIQITPNVLDEGKIDLQAYVSMNTKSIVQEQEQKPVFDRRSISTNIRLSPGQSCIIGGTKQAGLITKPNKDVKDSEVPATKMLVILTPMIVDTTNSRFETMTFQLKYADPDLIKERIEGSYKYPDNEPQETVKVIAFPTTKQVTVIASPENLSRIAEQIAEWDTFQVFKPRIIELQNSDPAQMAGLMTKLFSEEGGDEVNIRNVILSEDIAGPLSSHFTFEVVPETSKIIVISNIPKAYDAVGQLILELDKQKMATKDVKQVREWIARLIKVGRLGVQKTTDESQQPPASKPVIRVYDISDLVSIGERISRGAVDVMMDRSDAIGGGYVSIPDQAFVNEAQKIVNLITQTIDPNSWFQNNPNATGIITPYPPARPRKLAIHQTLHAHEQIEKFLLKQREQTYKTQISIALRYLYTDVEFLDEVRDSMGIEFTSDTILDDSQLETLLRASQKKRNVKSLMAPMPTVFNNETARFSIAGHIFMSFLGYSESNNLSQQSPPAQIRITPHIEDNKNIIIDFIQDIPGLWERVIHDRSGMAQSYADIIAITNKQIPKNKTFVFACEIRKADQDNRTASPAEKKILIVLIKPTIRVQEEMPREEPSRMLIMPRIDPNNPKFKELEEQFKRYDERKTDKNQTNNQTNATHLNPGRKKVLSSDKGQIMFDIKILTAGDEFMKYIGFDPNSVANSEGWADYLVDSTDDSASFIIDQLHADLLLRNVAARMQTYKDIQMFHGPEVLVLSGMKHEMHITDLTDSEHYIIHGKGGSPDSNAFSVEPESESNPMELGTTIRLIPTLTPDGKNIELDFEWEYRRILSFEEHADSDGKVQKVPQIDVDSIKTPYTIPDGKTLLIAGKKITVQKKKPEKPQLADLPLIGMLFSNPPQPEQTKNLLIMVTPTTYIKAPSTPQSLQSLHSLVDPNDPLIKKLEEQFKRYDERKKVKNQTKDRPKAYVAENKNRNS
jgi:beta-lactamase regulating signal transducer with metallopeptidase domain/type II secretory pathway component GspD/PulD (secretin)